MAGSQKRGDAYVVATMGAIFADPARFTNGADDRVELYRAFSKLWSSMNAERAAIAPHALGDATRGRDRIGSLSPQRRQAFLLECLEDFSSADIAAILDATPEQVERMTGEARAEIRGVIATDVLVIEDEPAIADDLKQIVRDLGHRVAGVARTRDEALALARRTQPGLLLVDIFLADGSSGIDAANEIRANHKAPAIFITAHPERLLTGERPEPTFLIPKPYKEKAVKAAISQALIVDQRAAPAHQA